MNVTRAHETVQWDMANPAMVDWGKAVAEGALTGAKVDDMRADANLRMAQTIQMVEQGPAELKKLEAEASLVSAQADAERQLTPARLDGLQAQIRATDAVTAGQVIDNQIKKLEVTSGVVKARNDKELAEATKEISVLTEQTAAIDADIAVQNDPSYVSAKAAMQKGDIIGAFRFMDQAGAKLGPTVIAKSQLFGTTHSALRTAGENTPYSFQVKQPDGTVVEQKLSASEAYTRGLHKEEGQRLAPDQAAEYIVTETRVREQVAQGVPVEIARYNVGRDMIVKRHTEGLRKSIYAKAEEYRKATPKKTDLGTALTKLRQYRQEADTAIDTLVDNDKTIEAEDKPFVKVAAKKMSAQAGATILAANIDVLQTQIANQKLTGVVPESEKAFMQRVDGHHEHRPAMQAILLDAHYQTLEASLRTELAGGVSEEREETIRNQLTKLKAARGYVSTTKHLEAGIGLFNKGGIVPAVGRAYGLGRAAAEFPEAKKDPNIKDGYEMAERHLRWFYDNNFNNGGIVKDIFFSGTDFGEYNQNDYYKHWRNIFRDTQKDQIPQSGADLMEALTAALGIQLENVEQAQYPEPTQKGIPGVVLQPKGSAQ